MFCPGMKISFLIGGEKPFCDCKFQWQEIQCFLMNTFFRLFFVKILLNDPS